MFFQAIELYRKLKPIVDIGWITNVDSIDAEGTGILINRDVRVMFWDDGSMTLKTTSEAEFGYREDFDNLADFANVYGIEDEVGLS